MSTHLINNQTVRNNSFNITTPLQPKQKLPKDVIFEFTSEEFRKFINENGGVESRVYQNLVNASKASFMQKRLQNFNSRLNAQFTGTDEHKSQLKSRRLHQTDEVQAPREHQRVSANFHKRSITYTERQNITVFVDNPLDQGGSTTVLEDTRQKCKNCTANKFCDKLNHEKITVCYDIYHDRRMTSKTITTLHSAPKEAPHTSIMNARDAKKTAKTLMKTAEDLLKTAFDENVRNASL